MIRCDEHGQSPGCIVCTHLLSGRSRHWVEVPVPGAECSDWLCPACLDRDEEALFVAGDLAVICMHHARSLRESATAEGEDTE